MSSAAATPLGGQAPGRIKALISKLTGLASKLRDIAPLLTVASLSLAVVGVVFSLWQAYKSDESRKQLRSIADSVSTTYVAEFPDDLPAITKLVANTKKT